MKKALFIVAALALAAALTLAHPHLTKSVSAKLGDGTEIKISYYTSPANMIHVENAKEGSFETTRALLSVSGDLMDGKIPAGDYTVGAMRDADGNWTMGLYPGKMTYGQSADASKVIRLDSHLSKQAGMSDHVFYDLAPGSGDMAGKLVIVWHFGDLHLSGAIA